MSTPVSRRLLSEQFYSMLAKLGSTPAVEGKRYKLEYIDGPARVVTGGNLPLADVLARCRFSVIKRSQREVFIGSPMVPRSPFLRRSERRKCVEQLVAELRKCRW